MNFSFCSSFILFANSLAKSLAGTLWLIRELYLRLLTESLGSSDSKLLLLESNSVLSVLYVYSLTISLESSTC